jgi:flagellar basal-body rod modification protein FlgD
MAINPTSAVGATSTSGASVQRDNTMLGKDDFLKILVGQLQNMDPMSQSSSDPSQTTQQMTQFSILEQLTNLSASQTAMATNDKQTQAMAMLGKTVDYTDGDGNVANGAVNKVDFASDGSIKLTIGDQTGIDPSAISGVQ